MHKHVSNFKHTFIFYHSYLTASRIKIKMLLDDIEVDHNNIILMEKIVA